MQMAEHGWRVSGEPQAYTEAHCPPPLTLVPRGSAEYLLDHDQGNPFRKLFSGGGIVVVAS